jgi:hypothetical protein
MDGWACSIQGRDKKLIQNFNWRIILKLILKLVCGDVDWIHVAHKRYMMRALVNTVMNLRVA